MKLGYDCESSTSGSVSPSSYNMAPIALENEDHSRDAAFNKAMHGKSADSRGGFHSMLNKDHDAHRAATDEYFKHWDNKSAGTETAEIREVRVTAFNGHGL